MKVGIISDTHDNMPLIRRAVELFRAEGVSLVVHAGDFVAPFTLALYRELGCDFIGVFGNNDGDQVLLKKRSDGRIHSAPHEFSFGGKRFIVTHYPDAVDAMAAGADVVIHGHTHDPVIRKSGNALIINPGECGGWSTGRSTVAVLDVEAMKARVVDLDFRPSS
ncbi:MAG: metallophosphoesterase [Nitrospirae bacterium]|nr:metallophosphoesterase [Nitrospirota bacterium]